MFDELERISGVTNENLLLVAKIHLNVETDAVQPLNVDDGKILVRRVDRIENERLGFARHVRSDGERRLSFANGRQISASNVQSLSAVSGDVQIELFGEIVRVQQPERVRFAFDFSPADARR